VAWTLLLALASLPAGALRGGFTDADDVSLALDLKAVSHTNDERSVTYTVETWQSFPDPQANFRWALSRGGAQAPDRFVSVRWEGGLVATVTDGTGQAVGAATAWRPAPNTLRVSIPLPALGEGGAYSYQVTAVTDLDGDGAGEAGEVDVAPDSGWHKHGLSLGSRVPAAGSQLVDGPAPRPVAAPAASPPAPAPAPAAAVLPAPAVVSAPTGPPTPRSTPAAVLDAAMKSASPVEAPVEALAAGPPAAPPAPAPAAAPVPALPRTGPGTLASLMAGFLLCLGGFCVAVGRPATR
jgi:hypothetical protein